jgi:hypothetical protein
MVAGRKHPDFFQPDIDAAKGVRVYAYSDDDAIGNIQAEAQGFIIDIGSLTHLENQLTAAPPINIALGYASTDTVRSASYSVCSNDPKRTKPVNPLNPAFIINANAPQNCAVYLTDNKPVQQTYTFTVTKPPPFTIFTLSQVMNGDAKWSNGPTGNTTSVIDCSGNQTTPPFQQSSKAWCCSLTSSSGVFAYSQPDPHDPPPIAHPYRCDDPSSAQRHQHRRDLQHGPFEGRERKRAACRRPFPIVAG